MDVELEWRVLEGITNESHPSYSQPPEAACFWSSTDTKLVQAET